MSRDRMIVLLRHQIGPGQLGHAPTNPGPQATSEANFESRVFHPTEDPNGKVGVCVFFSIGHVCHFVNAESY